MWKEKYMIVSIICLLTELTSIKEKKKIKKYKSIYYLLLEKSVEEIFFFLIFAFPNQ